MNSEIIIYNDVIGLYTYKNEKIVGLEIYSEDFAEMQKKIFDFIWMQCKSMKIIDKRGGAKLLSDK
ncbi:MAG TPA: hypothetical protein PK957_03210 [Candidatus Dojkabacteria bacterium]|nr:hypothetical protein [Candidatus Dojkabacteria bacterium]HQF37090.1 hypothetical protein [Candidatus Dojkabacteria bacterium]